ncbi:MAG TPA: ABC transporter permease [Blastocatellia bacterium]|nr:ABC transporter permease [Blastocatellia bacterium]
MQQFFEALKIALASLQAHKLRSFLTLLGVIFGVITVVAVASVIEGFFRYTNQTLTDRLGSNTVVLDRIGQFGITSFEEFLERIRRNKEVTLDDLDYLREHSKLAQSFAAQAYSTAEVGAGNRKLTDLTVRGVTASMADIDIVQADRGRYLSRVDEDQRRYVTLIGAEVARQLFDTVEVVGREITIDGRPFEVIGVAQELGSSFGQSQDEFVIIPVSVFENMWGVRRGLSISIKAADGVSVNDLQDEIRLLMRARRHLSYSDKDTFSLLSAEAVNSMIQGMLGLIAAVALAITSISLVVGGIVVMNIMLVTVTERTREIGIRKSLGARRRDILMQFLIESTVLSGCGGLIGLAIATLVSWFLVKFTPVPSSIPAWAVVAAISVSIGVGLVFGIYPAWKASKLDPIVALRAE